MDEKRREPSQPTDREPAKTEVRCAMPDVDGICPVCGASYAWEHAHQICPRCKIPQSCCN
ncbi:hypothetical protein [Vulgatibacter incomptus]|nr:hypothetical protein [Vulgatibacter incomptus]